MSPAELALAAGESAALTSWTYKAEKRSKFPKSFASFDGASATSFEKGTGFEILGLHCLYLPITDQGVITNSSIVIGQMKRCEPTISNHQKGLVLGEAQNLARELMELPSNLLTPKLFSQRIIDELAGLGVEVNVYGADWIKEQKMNAFWSVAKGSIEEPQFVEMIWNGEKATNEKTFCLVGKGVTFDSGGISIKPSAKMGDMRGDMGGAAVTVGAMLAVAKLKLPGRVVAVTPLAENMPSHNASKPGDVVIARNGKSIQIDNTDAEGRLLLCDALGKYKTYSNSNFTKKYF